MASVAGGGLLGVLAVVILARAVDDAALVDAARQAAGRPAGVAIAVGAFGFAFVLRAIAWRRVLPTLTFGQAIAGIHLALGANHVLPFRMGEPLRVMSAVRRNPIGFEAAAASTVTLRAVDLVAVVALGAAAAPTAFFGLVGWWIVVVAVTLAGATAAGWWWLRSIEARRPDVRLPGPVAVVASVLAWPTEAVLVWQVAGWAGLELSAGQALLVTTVSVAAQVVAVTPGGLGTYEAAAVAAYVALGFDPEPALVAALGTHALKTAYSIVAGGVAVLVPAPSLLGRLRLGPPVAPGMTADGSVGPPVGGTEAATRTGSDTVATDHRSASATGGRPAGDGDERPVRSTDERSASATGRRSAGDGDERPAAGSVLLFMPAFNEEAAVGACVARVPSTVHGRRVEVLVIDDGSTDATADRARAAGADVIELGANRGLGAAVREGLAEGVRRGVDAVVFCDADGEYPPEELAAMVAPILDGRADYVTGSRFLGRIDHMRPHRRLGNLVLTRLLSVVARTRISDGQTGYRALAPAAAASAEIIHDFNYAQVLTLDLLAKGFRHVEVPISYHFRTTGDSFVKLGPYLRRVVPAVYRELNSVR